MDNRKARLTAISLLAFFSQSGFGSQIGILIGPIASKYNIEMTSAAALFTVLIGGSLLGNSIAYFVFDFIKIKIVTIASYVMVLLFVMGFFLTDHFYYLPVAFLVIGICSGIGVCAGGTLVSQLWVGRHRQVIIVSQDAVFNLAGALFPLITEYLLARNFDWSTSYMAVASASVVIIILSMMSTFDTKQQNINDPNERTEWNINIILSGICLLVLMIAQYSIIIWAPQYVEQSFGVSPNQSAGIISNFYTAALFTSIVATFVVSKLQIEYFIGAMILLGFYCAWRFLKATSFEEFYYLSFIFGVAIAATYNSFLVYGVNFVESPSHKNVSFMLISGGIGAALAPYLSGKVVERFDTYYALNVGWILFSVVFALLIWNEVISRLKKGSAVAS